MYSSKREMQEYPQILWLYMTYYYSITTIIIILLLLLLLPFRYYYFKYYYYHYHCRSIIILLLSVLWHKVNVGRVFMRIGMSQEREWRDIKAVMAADIKNNTVNMECHSRLCGHNHRLSTTNAPQWFIIRCQFNGPSSRFLSNCESFFCRPLVNRLILSH